MVLDKAPTLKNLALNCVKPLFSGITGDGSGVEWETYQCF